MNQATMGKGPDFEQALLSHVELCYSVALVLTHNQDRALALTKDTLSWAWHLNDGPWNANALKMALLTELRGRYVRDYRIELPRPAPCRLELQEAFA